MRTWQGPLAWYTRYIFPHIMDWSLRQPPFQRERYCTPASIRQRAGSGVWHRLEPAPLSSRRYLSLTTVDPHAVLPNGWRNVLRQPTSRHAPRYFCRAAICQRQLLTAW